MEKSVDDLPYGKDDLSLVDGSKKPKQKNKKSGTQVKPVEDTSKQEVTALEETTQVASMDEIGSVSDITNIHSSGSDESENPTGISTDDFVGLDMYQGTLASTQETGLERMMNNTNEIDVYQGTLASTQGIRQRSGFVSSNNNPANLPSERRNSTVFHTITLPT